MNIRFATEKDLPAVNLLRKEVNDLHAAGKPEIFKPGFPAELQNYVYEMFRDPEKDIVVAEQDGALLGFAVLHEIRRPETPYMWERHFLDVDEFGVAEAARRQGIGRALIVFICGVAAERGLPRVELNMWEFNQSALAFYEAVGFATYRRYMELPVEPKKGERK